MVGEAGEDLPGVRSRRRDLCGESDLGLHGSVFGLLAGED